MDTEVIPERGAWKSDPMLNGRAGSLGDVGTHAFHLLRFVTGLIPLSLTCKMSSYSKHHNLDDYGQAIIQTTVGATGSVLWSQVSHGRLNDLTLQVDGTKGALEWHQEDPIASVMADLENQPLTSVTRVLITLRIPREWLAITSWPSSLL